MKRIVCLGLSCWAGAAGLCALTPAELAEAVQAIRAVGPEGQGNAQAAPAWRRLAAAEMTQLPLLLAAMDGANDYAANWLRAVVETVVDRRKPAGVPLPLAELGGFLLDTRHHPRARRLAFELIAATDAPTAEKLLPGLLDDPSNELRREAVSCLVAQARQTLAAGNPPGATLLFQQALRHTRDVDQLDSITKQLRDLGQPVDLPALFGFLTRWQVVGPFDNTGRKGFEAVYPPERSLDLAAEYQGKSARVRWQDTTTTNDYGLVDINKACGKLKEVTAYAFTTFDAERAQPAELRLGCKNAWKVWLNGQFLFGRDEYHRGIEIDQYRLATELRAGQNRILVKVCQNEEVEDWTVEWEFQLRVTDPLGTPIRPATASPTTAP